MRRMMYLGIAALTLAACTENGDVTGVDDVAIDAEASRYGDPASPRTYEITITNLTEGQPLSPGVVATHRANRRIFRLGMPASEGIRLIAENGDPSTAVAELSGADGIHEVQATEAPVGCVGCPGPFDNELTLMVTTEGKAKRLSLAVMLICSNDGFAGVNSVPLPNGFWQRTYYARAYDAGTEANDELWNSVVDPCGAIGPVEGPLDGTNDRPATDGRVARHRGIKGVGDLTEAHAWTGAIARVTVRRVE